MAGEPARGLGASRRPFGDVRFTGSPARCDDAPAGQCPPLPRLYRGTTTKQQPTKVSTLSQDLTKMISGYLFSRFDTVFAGGAFDQGGLTKPAMSIFMMEVFAALGYSLSVRISRPQWWRIACIMTCLAAFVAPIALAVHYSWELTRYIAVMGITPSRIMGVRFAILFLFVPLVCLAGCFVGAKSIKRVTITAGICLIVAYMMFRTVDTAARKSISCHPRPKLCMPNMIWVPDTPETSPDYGLKEILFY